MPLIGCWPSPFRHSSASSIKMTASSPNGTPASDRALCRSLRSAPLCSSISWTPGLQRDASIEDQVRLCRERATREGWEITGVYTDHAVSGASLIRPGIQQLMQDAVAGKFEIILAEAMDRLSRDQADIAAVFKRLRFAGVAIVTLSEGEIGDLHIGLKGTMNALFLKDLADKTRRGLRGRVEAVNRVAGTATAMMS